MNSRVSRDMFHIKIQESVMALNEGGVIAYPTEAVWGLGCDPFDGHAVFNLLGLKRRRWQKGLILVAGDVSQFDFILHDLCSEDRAKLSASWPGPITWLVPHRQRVPSFVSGEHDTIALRVSAHPIIKALCEHYNAPIVSTSANPQGLSPALSRFKAHDYFHNSGVTFAPGVVGTSDKPSVIIDLLSGSVIR